MPSPTPLAIATLSVQRLVREEASYHQELAQQEAKVGALTSGNANAGTGGEEDENAGFALRQEQAAILETKAVFPPLHARIADALLKLEDLIESAEEEGGKVGKEELESAKEVVGVARGLVGR